MNRNTIARFAGIAAGAGLALGVFAPVGAQTVAQLQAQIAALMAQLQALQGGTGVTNAISSDLTVGSSGNSVVVLQNALVAQGYLTMPAGVAPGYFGALTKAAVMKWQAANGLPATGYFGAMSRAKFNAGGVAGGTTTGGTTVGGTTGGTTGVITTPGAEGTITVSVAPVANTTVFEGQDAKEVLAFKVKATGSDVAVQRVKIDLGDDADVYREVFSKIYLVDDAGRTLASSDLNSSTVVKNGNNEYEITLSGFSSVVAKDATRTYSVKVDVNDSIESADLGVNYTLSVAEQGVRAIDGAGIDIYSENSELASRSVNVDASLAESATLTLSTNASTPAAQEVIAANGSSENELDKVVLLVFDIRAEKDDIEITDIIDFAVTATGGTAATASTTYLYAGNGTSGTLLASDSGTGSTDVADFTDISVVIPAGTTKTFTLAADIRNANAVATTFAASLTGTTSTIEGLNSNEDEPTISGSATGNSVIARNAGPVFSLVGTPTITRDAGTIGIANGTSTARATFNLKIKAVGADVLFGNNASTTYPMISNGTGAPARSFDIYLGGALSNPAVASSTDYAQPSSGVVSSSNSFTLQEGNEVTIPVSFVFEGRTTAGALVTTGSYAVGLERINWVLGGTQYSTTYMDGRTEWRTGSVTMP